MKSIEKKGKLTVIPNSEFRKSRAGLLGRFPSEELYESEKQGKQFDNAAKSKGIGKAVKYPKPSPQK